MAKYRTKPVEIEAIQWTGDNIDEIWETFGNAGIGVGINILFLTTADGNLVHCEIGSWVIPDNRPETFYPCNDDYFQKKYEVIS